MNKPFNVKDWDNVISFNDRKMSLNLKEVWQYRDLILLFVKRDFSAQFKQTILGPFWHILQPLFTTAIFAILFNRIANMPTDDCPSIIFYMTGICIWNYFSSCFVNTSTTFVSNASIFGKVYFPRLVLPFSVIISNIIRFSIQFLILIIVMLLYTIFKGYHIQTGLHTLLIPVITLVMAILGLGLGIIISSITTKYRDFNVLVTFGIQLLMFITPVAYSYSYLIKSKYLGLIKLNPLSSLVEGFRYAVLGKGVFDFQSFIYSLSFAMITLIIGILIFNKVEKNFMDTV